MNERLKEIAKTQDYIIAQHSIIMDIDKTTCELEFANETRENTGKYTNEITNLLIDAWQRMEEVKKKYKPNYHTGQKSNLSEFKAIQNPYYKEPINGVIAPWTKAEKAYYESLKTKRERDKYLVIQSGIRNSVIDIPLDAIANIDEDGNLINEEYREFYEIVGRNRGLAHLSNTSLAIAEWDIAADMLGDIKGFSGGETAGFITAMYRESFPAKLRAKILDYAKKHNIKE
ncbi:hypothetical protein [Helicobacter didelphidarum]|uniref:hypothetical protein n=1 Tax=Helicobacter didelphidarum TaxID=2040648 RepID=UPI0015F133A4|nr:hypothetical protein [Helicobacter didelphidarum]